MIERENSNGNEKGCKEGYQEGRKEDREEEVVLPSTLKGGTRKRPPQFFDSNPSRELEIG